MPTKLFLSISREEDVIVEFLNDTFRKAVQDRVHDIHFQQSDQLCRVRFRMPGGMLVDYKEVDRKWMQVIDEKIRSRARLSVPDKLTIHSGRVSLRIDGFNVDVRVEIAPAVNGNGNQLIVCRLLNQANSNIRLSDIKMTPSVRECFERILEEPHGLFLVTGPTGSGKTTTLYSLLNELNDSSRNIITIENPVEYCVPQFHQMNVDERHITFPGALRSALRQDPDVILVGEIRDQETAHIAVQAAITGHLVFSTLHANNAPTAITRMLDFGIDAHTLSAALRGVSAQRLIPVLGDPSSCVKTPPNEAEKMWLKAYNIHRQNPEYLRAQGPKDYRGFIPVMEVIVADHRVKRALPLAENRVDEIYSAANRQYQFETLAQAAERLAFSGITSLDKACLISSTQEAPFIKYRRLGQVLVENGWVPGDEIDKLLEAQAVLRKEGDHRRLGQMLVEKGMCSVEQLIEAIGFTAEAFDVLSQICTAEECGNVLESLVQKWDPRRESLFKMAIDAGLVSFEELLSANTF